MSTAREQRSTHRLWGLLRGGLAPALLALGAGCSSGLPAADATAGGPVGECSALGPMLDLTFAMEGGTTTSSRGVKGLARMEEEWGYLAIAREAAPSLATAPGAEILETLEVMRAKLERARSKAARLAAQLAESHRELSSMLDEAALCDGVDQRDPTRTPEEVAAKKRDPANDDIRDETKKRNQTALRSQRCTQAVKLWSGLRQLDLYSHDSVAAAGHLSELSLDGDRGQLRDRLVQALPPHGTRLKELQTVIEEYLGSEVEHTQPFRVALNKQVDALRLRCLPTLEVSDRVATVSSTPRNAIVVVRPKWPHEVVDLTGKPNSFGTGFVVQWTSAQGQRETRVLTNNHVMAGASEADILLSDQEDDAKGDRPLQAVLIRLDPYDDVAILRVVPNDAAQLSDRGVAFRREGAEEQEAVVAAGFPGMGAKPSYQVSEGVVSNAKFGGNQSDIDGVSAYVQHTAAIDPGNSGGPLLDSDGRVLGMNTLKAFDRENVGLAIPTARIELALLRADEPTRYDVRNAQAACDLFVSALAEAEPAYGDLDRFGLALYPSRRAEAGESEATRYRNRLRDAPEDAFGLVRARVYGALRVELEADGGVPAFSTCRDVALDGGGTQRYRATFATTKGTHQVTIAPEGGLLRVVALSRRP